MKRAWLASVVLLAACSDALEQTTSAGQVVATVDSVGGTLSLIRVDDRTVSTVPVPPGGSTPGRAAARGKLLVVPGGNSPTLAVFDFSAGDLPSVAVRPLPGGASAAGVTLEGDSIAWVARPEGNSVTRVDLRSGDTASVAVGVAPYALATMGSRLYVVNANVVGGNPAGSSWISVVRLTPGPPAVVDSIGLTGTNARFITRGVDHLYVVNAGTAGLGDGKLSIIDTVAPREEAVLNGLGESPGHAVYHRSGRLLVASPAGVLEVNTTTRALTRGPGAAVNPGGAGVAALALDQAGRVYAFDRRDCVTAGVAHVLSAPPDYSDLQRIAVGVCPVAAATIVLP